MSTEAEKVEKVNTMLGEEINDIIKLLSYLTIDELIRLDILAALHFSSETPLRRVVKSPCSVILYGCDDFKETLRNIKDVHEDAFALYHVSYDYAKSKGDLSKCNFVWKFVGHALSHFHAIKAKENCIVCHLFLRRY
ncbi:hypothetical protein POM88_006778 [Heracleum sosnowskyi]|uniref:RDRP C-terminal head domain-containing protein n=1 Tax=Heracleum sosnowskyi TaxID=360622 RepID=A0AAD8N0A8_9APIA|nr:hypothetical protein POM88_006778 [Heracleum sosnowskyi]